MTRATYEQAYADHCYLWETHGPAGDMSGGYVDQDDLVKLLKSPTKAMARDCLVSQIIYWFSCQLDDGQSPDDIAAADPEVREIRERYT